MKTFFITPLIIFFISQAEARFQDTGFVFKRLELGISGFTGLSYLSGQPERSYSSAGSSYGTGFHSSYNLNSRIALGVDFRFIKSNNVLNFNYGVLPDIFLMGISTLQIPVFVSYSFHNKKKKDLFTAGFGASYNWNTYNTIYEEPVIKNPSTVNIRQISVNSSDQDFSLIFSVSKNIALNNKGTIRLRMFSEFQLNMNASSFKDRVHDPFVVYIIELNQDKVTPLYIRTGFYLNVGL